MGELNVLILEDEELQREVIEGELIKRGFQAKGVGSATEALEIADRLGDDLGLVVLDMRLGHGMNGAEVGIQIRDRLRSNPPEFLINSGYLGFKYYEAALNLGASAYLQKGGDLRELIRHVRALYLRRMIREETLGDSQLLGRVAVPGFSRLELMTHFCNTVLLEAMNKVLGAPYLLLLSSRGKGTTCCATNISDLPLGTLNDYNTILVLAFRQADAFRPFVLNSRLFSEAPLSGHIASRLDGAAFIPLVEDQDFLLYLGILQASDRISLAEDPVALAEVLARYFRSALVSSILSYLAARRQGLPRSSASVD